MRLTELQQLLSLSRDTARDAVRHAMENAGDARKVELDLRRDVKVGADHMIEESIICVLSECSDFPIFSEERGFLDGRGRGPYDGYRWIIDPLDGSLNFSRGIPLCCVSIGLWKEAEPVLGVVYDFSRDETFTGIVGNGAWLNGAAITVSGTVEKSKAVLCTGFPVSTAFSTEALLGFVQNIRDFKKVRLFGSAALSLSYVACGRADYYQENDIKLWDVAAGIALVKAAGGAVKYIAVSDTNTLKVEASNPALLESGG